VETPGDPARAYFHLGQGCWPMHACSCSKAIAVFPEESFRDDIVAGPLKACTEHT
jgi:IclR family acetate operon transcriptional repressor